MSNEITKDQTQPLDPQAAALRAMIAALLDEKLEAKLEEMLQPIRQQLARIEEDSRARYVDLRNHMTKLQASFDILNNKFDAQGDEVKFLRKSVRTLEDKTDAVYTAD
jgi:predicted nuclease with TOPRIM domain